MMMQTGGLVDLLNRPLTGLGLILAPGEATGLAMLLLRVITPPNFPHEGWDTAVHG